ncbi:hypothetical protein KDN24_24725 [Bacillus sp. Bva_UNVM-123]|uniref:hypothetical protein n=1 Tax=Bacillus sp. Bva_UNVM-123 TaxID=2829798 RepID=UPI00391F4F85
MRVKKYKRELELYEKKEKERSDQSGESESIAILEKLLTEKEDVINILNKENEMVKKLYEEAEINLKQLTNQINSMKVELKAIQNELLTLRDEQTINMNKPIEINHAPSKQPKAETDELLELKQQLTDIQSFIIKNNNAVPPSMNPVNYGIRKSSYTFRDLQNASRINMTSNMNNNKSHSPKFSPQMNQNTNVINTNVTSFNNSVNPIAPVTETKSEDHGSERHASESSQVTQKEKNVLSAFSFLKKKSE